ncbi:zinc-finger double domain-containing protein [Phthorimaea operculella]|nr:zinc-finger double domain-containing protein [Phthorimaea operculella]
MEGFCKACLVRYEDPSELLQYTEKNRRMYVYCTGLQVKPNDIIPLQICQACYMKLKMACEFKKQCRTSDKRLNHFLSLKEAGEETDFSTYLQHTEGSTLFNVNKTKQLPHISLCRFPLNGTGTPSYQKPKDDDNVSTSTSIRNFMADFLREDEVPDTEANIIREIIEREADVLDDSLDSHWLQDDISIASDFRFSPFSTPLSKHSYQPLLNYSPVKHEPLETKEETDKRNILAAKKLLLNPKSCSSSQTDSPRTLTEQQNDSSEDLGLPQIRNVLSAKLKHFSKSCASSQGTLSECSTSPRGQDNYDIDVAVKVENFENDSCKIKTEVVESIDEKSYVSRKRMLLKRSHKDNDETSPKLHKGKDMDTILANHENNKENKVIDQDIETFSENHKRLHNKIENKEPMDVMCNLLQATSEIYDSITQDNINQDVFVTNKGYYIENDDANENTVRIVDDTDKKDNIEKNIEKILNNTDDEVISLSALLASPSSGAAPVNNIIATPSVHQGLSGANTPSIENILFGEKLDEHSIKPDLNPKEEISDENTDVDILGDFFDKYTGKYVGEFEKDQEEIFEEYKNSVLDIPGKSQFDLSDFSCKKCMKKYQSEKGLKIHFAKFHNLKIISERKKEERGEFPCERCGKIFGFKSNLLTHLRVMHIAPKQAVKCKVCSVEFTSEGKLKLHMKVHGGNMKETPKLPSERHVCPICGHACTKSYNLKVHIARHNKTVAFKCDHCDRGFYTRCDLENHIRKHMGMKPFECTQCNDSFRRKDQLQIHLKKHAGERPFICENCSKTFRTNAHLRYHCKHSTICKNKKIEDALIDNIFIEASIRSSEGKTVVKETHANIRNEEVVSKMEDKGKETPKLEDLLMDVDLTSNAAKKSKEDAVVKETHANIRNEETVSKIEDKGEETPKLEDLLMDVDLTSNAAKESKEDEDDKLSLTDLLTIPVVIQQL